MSRITVSALNIYPIKAVRGVSLPSAWVEKRGLAGDRRWLIVDEEGVFVTQRDHPILATVSAQITDTGLELAHPSSPAISVQTPNGPGTEVRVWRSTVEAIDAGEEASKWFSGLLGFPARLVFMKPGFARQVDLDYAVEGDAVSFADGFPILIVNESSLHDLNARMAVPVPINRFRGNIVVSGAPAWVEHEWKTLEIGGIRFRNAKPCARCIVTTTDQETGARMGEEPLRTLARVNNIGTKAVFGSNLIPDSEGMISVGDEVRVS